MMLHQSRFQLPNPHRKTRTNQWPQTVLYKASTTQSSCITEIQISKPISLFATSCVYLISISSQVFDGVASLASTNIVPTMGATKCKKCCVRCIRSSWTCHDGHNFYSRQWPSARFGPSASLRMEWQSTKQDICSNNTMTQKRREDRNYQRTYRLIFQKWKTGLNSMPGFFSMPTSSRQHSKRDGPATSGDGSEATCGSQHGGGGW